MQFRITWIVIVVAYCLAIQIVAAQPAATRFRVERYEVAGMNPLSAKATAKVLQNYLGEHEGLEGVQAAADALESSLRTAGHSFHRVILPPQTLQGGVVKFEVVEFVLGEIKIKDNRYFKEHNIRNSLRPLIKGQAPNTQKLSHALNFANQHPAKQISLSFRESDQARAVDASLEIKDRNPMSFFSALQNTGTEETGELRFTLGYQHTNLFNRDHNAAVVFTTSEESGTVQQAGFSYRIPFYSHAGSVSINYTNSDVESGQIEDFFSISGKGSVTGLAYQYMIPGSSRYRHSISLSYDDKLFENVIEVDGQEQVGSGSGDVRTSPISLTYAGTLSTLRTSFGYSATMVTNQAGGSNSSSDDYQNIRDGADPDWTAVRYALNYDWRFVGKWMLRLRYLGQQAGEPLVPGEQFGLGGANSVRGYEERSVLGDNGWQFNTEIWAPAMLNDSLYTLLFVDTGEAETEEFIDPTAIDTSDLNTNTTQEPSSVGIGVRWNWGETLAVKADFASVLETVGTTEDGDSFFHFSLFYRF